MLLIKSNEDKIPISFFLETIRSVYNVGSIFRSGDGFGVQKIYLAGYTAYPPREDLSKTALGSEDAVPWEHFENPIDAAKKIIKEGALSCRSFGSAVIQTAWV